MPAYFLGLDLGQVQDHTALAVLEATAGAKGGRRNYSVRHLTRWPLGTRYTSIADDLKALLTRPPQQAPPFDAPPLAGSPMAVDATGCGRPVLELFQNAGLRASLRPVLITCGHLEHFEDGMFHVPKKSLVAVLQVLLQSRRLLIAQGLPLAEVLGKELANFKIKVTLAANEVFGEWRAGQHDDLVLAVAMAAWLAERSPVAGQAEPMALGVKGGWL